MPKKQGERFCIVCKKPVTRQSKTGKCRECAKSRMIYDPTEDEIRMECLRIRAEGGGTLHPFFRNRPFTLPESKATFDG